MVNAAENPYVPKHQLYLFFVLGAVVIVAYFYTTFKKPSASKDKTKPKVKA